MCDEIWWTRCGFHKDCCSKETRIVKSAVGTCKQSDPKRSALLWVFIEYYRYTRIFSKLIATHRNIKTIKGEWSVQSSNLYWKAWTISLTLFTGYLYQAKQSSCYHHHLRFKTISVSNITHYSKKYSCRLNRSNYHNQEI